MSSAAPPKTKTAFVVEVLRDAMVNGELVGGHRFDVRRIAKDLNVSITPVREALRILQADGWVDYDEHRAISVIDLTPVDAAEIYALRSVVEGFATQRAADALSDDGRELVRTLHASMEEAVARGDVEAARVANRSWHFAIYKSAVSRFTIPIIERLWAAFIWNSIWSVPGRLKQSLDEHAAITVALLEGDGVRAGALMAEHVGGGERAVQVFRRLDEEED